MITQIEIDGFKTFKDFKVELAPFQVLVGPNGSGKSNLFDALYLLSRLAEYDILTAFQGLRGSADDQFTKYPNGKRANKMRFVVEMLVDHKVRDRLGTESILADRRFRYEVEISTHDENGLEGLRVVHEALRFIPTIHDNWSRKYGFPSQTEKSKHLIETEQVMSTFNGSVEIPAPPRTEIRLVEEDDYITRTFFAERMDTTVLSSIVTSGEFPQVFAVGQEMRALKILHLNLEALHHPSSVKDPRSLVYDGSNVPTVLARMQAEDKFALTGVSIDMANLVPDIISIDVVKDESRNEYGVWAKYLDSDAIPSQLLSDGTLQLLVLATLGNDPQFHGLLGLEEPENGVHPWYFKRIARLLKELVTDIHDLQQLEEPLTQILVTTHSPTFIAQPDLIDSILFVHMVTRISPLSTGVPPIRITQAVPVLLSNEVRENELDKAIDKQDASYTIDQVTTLLTDTHLGEALDRLNTSRTLLGER